MCGVELTGLDTVHYSVISGRMHDDVICGHSAPGEWSVHILRPEVK